MTAEKKEIELRGRCGTCLFNGLLLKHENGVVAFEKEGCSLGQRAWLFRNWSKMVFIPLSVFAPVPNFHSEFKLQGLTQTRKTELKPFLANLGTHMRAKAWKRPTTN
jgi:hypothetical protein